MDITLSSGIYTFEVGGGGTVKIIQHPAANPDALPVTTGLFARFNASDLVLADGAKVATWADSSGNARDATQGTDALRPLYRASVAGFNNKPAVENTAAGGFMTASGGIPDESTMFVVHRTVTSVGAVGVLSASGSLAGPTDGSPRLILQDNGGTLRTYNHLSGTPYATVSAISINTSYITALTTGTTVNRNAWLNGVSKYSNVAFATGGGNDLITLFSGYNGSYKGMIAELIVYNRVLTGGEITQVTSFLQTKYGIA
jgi:hypothetical protein